MLLFNFAYPPKSKAIAPVVAYIGAFIAMEAASRGVQVFTESSTGRYYLQGKDAAAYMGAGARLNKHKIQQLPMTKASLERSAEIGYFRMKPGGKIAFWTMVASLVAGEIYNFSQSEKEAMGDYSWGLFATGYAYQRFGSITYGVIINPGDPFLVIQKTSVGTATRFRITYSDGRQTFASAKREFSSWQVEDYSGRKIISALSPEGLQDSPPVLAPFLYFPVESPDVVDIEGYENDQWVSHSEILGPQNAPNQVRIKEVAPDQTSEEYWQGGATGIQRLTEVSGSELDPLELEAPEPVPEPTPEPDTEVGLLTNVITVLKTILQAITGLAAQIATAIVTAINLALQTLFVPKVDYSEVLLGIRDQAAGIFPVQILSFFPAIWGGFSSAVCEAPKLRLYFLGSYNTEWDFGSSDKLNGLVVYVKTGFRVLIWFSFLYFLYRKLFPKPGI